MSITYLADAETKTPPTCIACGGDIRKNRKETWGHYRQRQFCSRRCVLTHPKVRAARYAHQPEKLEAVLADIEMGRAAGLNWADVAADCGKTPSAMARYLYRYGIRDLAGHFETASRQQVAA